MYVCVRHNVMIPCTNDNPSRILTYQCMRATLPDPILIVHTTIDASNDPAKLAPAAGSYHIEIFTKL